MKTQKNNNNNIPVWKRYSMTVEEAAQFYHIGETKLRRIAEEYPNADFIVMNGNRVLIKKQKFEEFLNNVTSI